MVLNLFDGVAELSPGIFHRSIWSDLASQYIEQL